MVLGGLGALLGCAELLLLPLLLSDAQLSPTTHTLPPHLPPPKKQPIPAARMRLAAATGLAAASVQAKLLADQEEREAQRLVLAAIEHQFKKVHQKLQVR